MKKSKKSLISAVTALGTVASVVAPATTALADTTNGWAANGQSWNYYTNGQKATGWKQVGQKWYLFDANGVMLTGWQQVGKKWYFMEASGAMATGWKLIGQTWYSLGADGAMATGWKQIGADWFFMNAGGAMVANGWVGGMYYMGSNGAMLTDTVTPDGYRVLANGAWDGEDKVNAKLSVKSVKAIDSITVAVSFNKAVDETIAEDTDKYVFNAVESGDDDLTIAEAELQDDNKTVYLTLNTATALADEAVDYTAFIDDVEDTDGEAMASYKKIVSLGDETRPRVVSAKLVDNDSIEIKFSEPVDMLLRDLEVVDSDDDAATDKDDDIVSFELEKDDDNENVYTLTGVSALDPDEDYTLRIFSGVKDYSGNVITPNPYEKEFNVNDDDDEPKISSMKVLSETAFKVVFNEAISTDSDFTVYIDNEVKAATIEEVDNTNGKEFNVTLDAAPGDETVKVSIDDYEDKSGNDGDKYSKLLKFEENNLKIESKVGKIETLGGEDYAVFKFEGDIDELNAVDDAMDRYNDSVLYEGNIDAGNFYIADTIGAPKLEDNELAIKVEGFSEGTYYISLEEGVVCAYGAENEKVSIRFTVSESSSDVEVDEERTEPESGAINSADNDEIMVYFTDEVNKSAINADNYTLDGSRVFEKAVFYGSDDKNVVRLTFKEDAVRYNGEYKFAIKNIEDADGNDVDNYSAYVEVNENKKPYISKAKVTDVDTIEVTFSEELAAGATIDGEDFVITVDGDEVDVQSCSLDTKVITITLADDIDEADAVVKVKTSNDFDVDDVNGNEGKNNYSKTATWDLD